MPGYVKSIFFNKALADNIIIQRAQDKCKTKTNNYYEEMLYAFDEGKALKNDLCSELSLAYLIEYCQKKRTAMSYCLAAAKRWPSHDGYEFLATLRDCVKRVFQYWQQRPRGEGGGPTSTEMLKLKEQLKPIYIDALDKDLAMFFKMYLDQLTRNNLIRTEESSNMNNRFARVKKGKGGKAMFDARFDALLYFIIRKARGRKNIAALPELIGVNDIIVCNSDDTGQHKARKNNATFAPAADYTSHYVSALQHKGQNMGEIKFCLSGITTRFDGVRGQFVHVFDDPTCTQTKSGRKTININTLNKTVRISFYKNNQIVRDLQRINGINTQSVASEALTADDGSAVGDDAAAERPVVSADTPPRVDVDKIVIHIFDENPSDNEYADTETLVIKKMDQATESSPPSFVNISSTRVGWFEYITRNVIYPFLDIFYESKMLAAAEPGAEPDQDKVEKSEAATNGLNRVVSLASDHGSIVDVSNKTPIPQNNVGLPAKQNEEDDDDDSCSASGGNCSKSVLYKKIKGFHTDDKEKEKSFFKIVHDDDEENFFCIIYHKSGKNFSTENNTYNHFELSNILIDSVTDSNSFICYNIEDIYSYVVSIVGLGEKDAIKKK